MSSKLENSHDRYQFELAFRELSSLSQLRSLCSNYDISYFESMRLMDGSSAFKIEREKIEELLKKLCFCDLKVEFSFCDKAPSVELNLRGLKKEDMLLKLRSKELDVTLSIYDFYECYLFSLDGEEENKTYIDVFNEKGESICRMSHAKDRADLWREISTDLKYK